jgi:hypothetical protein
MSDPWAADVSIHTFQFLLSSCPAARAPLRFQRDFATWFLATANDPLMDPMLKPVLDWLWDVNLNFHHQFDDIGARRKIMEAVAERLANSPESDNMRLLRQRAETINAQLSSSPGINIGGYPATEVPKALSQQSTSNRSIDGEVYHTLPATQAEFPITGSSIETI